MKTTMTTSHSAGDLPPLRRMVPAEWSEGQNLEIDLSRKDQVGQEQPEPSVQINLTAPDAGSKATTKNRLG